MIDGPRVRIGDVEYVIPPVTCWAAKRISLVARDASKKETDEAGWVDVLFEQIRLVLEPNYPGIDVEVLQKALPLRELGAKHAEIVEAANAAAGNPGEAGSP